MYRRDPRLYLRFVYMRRGKDKKYLKRVSIAEKILDVIHTDVCGKISVQTKNGSLYVVCFINEYSRH